MSNHDDNQPVTPVPLPAEMAPDLPPAPGTRRRPRNVGRFGTADNALPIESFAVGVSGRVRRNHPA